MLWLAERVLYAGVVYMAAHAALVGAGALLH
jgi:hypothetical protein